MIAASAHMKPEGALPPNRAQRHHRLGALSWPSWAILLDPLGGSVIQIVGGFPGPRGPPGQPPPVRPGAPQRCWHFALALGLCSKWPFPLTPDLRPTYARAAAPGTDCPGPSQSHLGPTWPALGRGKLVVVLMAYATTYAQLTPAYASLRQHVSNRDFPERFQ